MRCAGSVRWFLPGGADPLEEQVAAALRPLPDVLVLDQITPEVLPAVLGAAQLGVRVLAQLDCVFAGAGVVRHLADLGAPLADLQCLRWVVTVQRAATPCEACREPVDLSRERAEYYRLRYPQVILDGTFYRARQCAACEGTGRRGDVAIFDFFRADAPPEELLDRPSCLSREEYLLRLGILGRVALDDVLHAEADQLRRTYALLVASQRTLSSANAELNQRVAQLEAGQRVLTQRTQSLVSLQEVAQALISSTELEELAEQLSRHVRRLCGAERSILYLLRPDAEAEVLCVGGWNPTLLHTQLPALEVLNAGVSPASDGRLDPAPYNGWPPGIPPRSPDVEGVALKAGLRVPLVAQQEIVGLMIVHSTRKARFGAGEVALLQALANQAALAIQRAGLIESLRDKIRRLEAAQVDLIRKERLERELELARQVQQSLLPRVFPSFPGYDFAALSRPARQVGGDFYDVFALGEGRFGLVIADVSDKGMPAALFMALTRSLLLAEARRSPSPRATLNAVNRLLRELGDPEMFVTVFHGVVDTATGILTYVRAGHEAPFLLRGGEAFVLPGRGTFLGLLDLDELPLSEEQVQLQPGDHLVLFTDGLGDTLSPDREPFGNERLREFLAQHGNLPPSDLCAATFALLAEHQGAGEQYDDMAILSLSLAKFD